MSLIILVLLVCAAPSIPIAVYTDYSVHAGLVGVVLFILGLAFVKYETRDCAPGTSGGIGLLAIVVVPIFTFMVSNFIAALVKYIATHLTLVWS